MTEIDGRPFPCAYAERALTPSETTSHTARRSPFAIAPSWTDPSRGHSWQLNAGTRGKGVKVEWRHPEPRPRAIGNGRGPGDAAAARLEPRRRPRARRTGAAR